VDGIAVFEAMLIAHTTTRGELVNLASQFVPDPKASAATQPAAPIIAAPKAVVLAARNTGNDLDTASVTASEVNTGPEQRQKFKAPGLKGETELKLTWLPMEKNTLRLCWDVILTSRTRGEMYRLLVDAHTGEILVRRCLTDYLTDASYRVFTSDSPSPLSPGYATAVTTQPPLVARTLVTLSALDTNASPAGWINDGGNETLGNNVDAHTDWGGGNSPDLPRPQGSPFRVFDFPMDPSAQDPTNYASAAVVQLFYLNNWIHDKLYALGFTEAAGNFQSNNFGRGGLGGDAVRADAQDGSGVNNANFSTPPDGSAPRMQMFIFTAPSPRRDGDLDAEVVIHEYTHGLSNRRVGGGMGVSELQSMGMGEGWSDFYALALLSEPGDDVNGSYAMGAYASYQLGGTGNLQNYHFGIRRYPYSTDLSRNPLTFKDIDPAQADYCSSGAPYHTSMFGSCSASGASEVHNIGEVWCAMLWEARANLINRYGWTAGNQLILQLVTDGMNLSPPNPTFLQARDAILQADLVNTGGANRNQLWAAFAKRGLGFGATSPASSTVAGVHESFEPPDDLQITPASGFISSGPAGGAFTPHSFSLTLTNVGSNAVNWVSTNPAGWLDLSPSSGTLVPGGGAVTASATFNALATNLPMGVYSNTVWFTNLASGVAQSRQFMLRVGQPDYYTELFNTNANDLAFQTLTFTPDGSSSFYSLCRESATGFPSDPTGAISVSLSDDSYATVTLSGTNTVAIHNTRASVFHIGSNGYLTMNSGDATYSESFASHFNLPRVAALFHDLNPSTGGTISYRPLDDRVAVTYQNVPQYGTTLPNSFQIELFYDGRIRITYLTISCQYSLAGISAGQGVPLGFVESDLSSYDTCAAPDALDARPGTELSSQGYKGGPFSPPGIVYTLSNVGLQSLAWSATASQPWLTVDHISGNLAPGVATDVAVMINGDAQSLNSGMHAATVTFSNLVSGFRLARTVSLLVKAIPGKLVVLDSIDPANDLQLPLGSTFVSVSRRERLTITNTDPTHSLLISDITLAGSTYFEDFTDGLAQDWAGSPATAWSVSAGEYRAQAGVTSARMSSLYFGQAWQDCAAQALARRISSTGSAALLLLRASDDFHWGNATGTAYLFGINGVGSYYVGKQVGGVFSFIQPWTITPLLNLGASTNTVLASIRGSELRMYLNGQLAWSGTDASIPDAGRIGVAGFSGSGSEEVFYFDDLTLTEPVNTSAWISGQQQTYNANALAGGDAEVSPPVGAIEPLRDGGKVDNLILLQGPFRLEDVPTLPYTLPPQGRLAMDVTYSPTAAATNEARVLIDSNDADMPRAEVAVSGEGIPDYLVIEPAGGLLNGGPEGGPFDIPSATYVLSNRNPSTVNWSVGQTPSWVSVSPTNGTLIANGAADVQVSLTTAADLLAIGAHSTSMVFSNRTTGAVQQRAVTLKVLPRIITITNAGTALLTESFGTGNGAIDPGETVTLNLGLANIGTVGATNVVATLLATGGVTLPSSPKNYGALLAAGSAVSNAFTFTATGVCGGTLVATLQVQAGTNNLAEVAFTFRLGASSAILGEGFDTVAAPSLPPGWTATLTGAGAAWATTNALWDTLPNAAFAPDPGSAGENWLTSPMFIVPATNTQFSFRHAYSTESCCDAGWLQLSIGGEAFTDILSAGGSFVTNGYTAGIGWRGNSTGYPSFITTTANLPPAAQGQNVRLRWRFTADSSVSGVGWYVDTVSVGGGFTCCADPTIPTHFTWDGIASPQCANVPFPVTIWSRNEVDGIATNFTGVVGISGLANAAVPISPSFSGNFYQGAWTGFVTIPQMVSNLVLRAYDGVRPNADANIIQVVAPPRLQSERYGNVELFLWPLWPTGSPCFALESTTNLSQPVWAPMAYPPLQLEDLYAVPVEMNEPRRYFRLRATAP